MFQFPGFALINLCIQSISTWLCSLLAARMSNNNKHSGGLPHSEIHGSKLILSSPWLIAEYHVFHRLLLPRHSPNALLALDLIQKETGPKDRRDAMLVQLTSLFLDQKHTFPPTSVDVDMVHIAVHRVSVLDLDNTCSFQAGIHQYRLRKQPV